MLSTKNTWRVIAPTVHNCVFVLVWFQLRVVIGVLSAARTDYDVLDISLSPTISAISWLQISFEPHQVCC